VLAPLLLAAAALVPVAISGSASAAPTSNTFSCSNGAFMLTSDGDITQASDIAGTWTTLLSTGKGLNALAYNPEDRFLYAMLGNTLQKITRNGVVDLGPVTGLPVDAYLAGAFDVDTGSYYVSKNNDLHLVDISTMTASSVSVPAGIVGLGTDFVISDGWIWTVRSNKVAGFNLATNAHEQYTFDTSIVPSGSTGGAMWIDPSGTTLFVEMTTPGEVAEFTGLGSSSISTSVISSTNAVVAPIDGADCRKTTLTVTPDTKSRTYGDSVPSYTFDVAGFILGETAGTAAGYVAPTCSSSYSSTTPVSASPLTISCSGGSADDYTFDTTATAQLTVSAKSLLVTPDAKSRTYGDAAPTYTFNVTGFANGDTAGTAAGYVDPTCSSSYSSTTPVSASPLTISCSGGSADDYTFNTTATAQLTVSAKVLTVTPDAKSRTYGDAAPTYTFNVTGFANGDTAGTAAGYVAPTCSSSYSSTTPVSASPLTISCSGGSADDYTFDTTATANLVVTYPTESVNCSTDQYFRIAEGTLSSGSSFLSRWIDIASLGKMKNAIAIRPADNRVYGFPGRSSNVLYRGGIFGSQALGAVSGLPAAIWTGSDFDPASGLLYVGNRNGVYAVNVDTRTATIVNLPSGFSIGRDFVVVNGALWSYSAGSVSSLRISDGTLDQWSTSPGVSRATLKRNSLVGAMWFDSATNTVFGEITSDGTLVKFTGIGTATVVTSLVGGSNVGTVPIDGAICR